MKKNSKISFIILVSFFATLSSGGYAAARSWIGAGAGGAGTVFNTAANWTGTGALLATDDLTMNISTSNATITLNASLTINNFTFNVSGNNTGTLDMVASVLTMNGPFICNAVNYSNNANYSYLRINVGSAVAGMVCNNTATFHTTGLGTTLLYGPSASPGSFKFYNNVTWGLNCRTSAGAEPDMYFDAPVAQTITVNIDPSTTYTMPEDVWYGFVNSPTITFAGTNQPFFFGSYDGNVRIKNNTIVKANYCTLDGFSAVQNFYMDPGSKLEINYTNDFPQGGYNGYFLDVASTVEYLGAASAQTVSGTTLVSLAYGHLIIGGSGNKTAASGTITKGNFLIRSGATFLSSTFTHENHGDFTNDGTFTAGTSTHNFTGTAMQFIGGTLLPVFYRLTATNTSTGITLNRQVSVSNLLTLTSGIVYTSSVNFLEITSTGSSTTGSNASHVDGPMRKTGATAFVFPVGDNLIWARIAITAPGNATDGFTAQYFDAAYATLTPVIAPNSYVSSVEHWILDRTTGASNVSVTLYWENGTRSGINTFSTDLHVARFDGASWQDHGSGAMTGSAAAGTITTAAAVTAFSPFTFASITPDILINPLPIELLSFEAHSNSNQVDLNWSTASETNNDYFIIEKSKDAQNFVYVNKVDGAGNTTTFIDYFDIDYSPYSGRSYYRLKQTDFNGQISYSNIMPVEFNSNGDPGISLFPNPSTAGNPTFIALNSLKDQDILVVLRDATGREVFSKVLVVSADSEIIAIDKECILSKGIYLVTAASSDLLYSKKLIIN